MLKVDVADIKFADGVFSSQKTNQTLTIKEVAKASLDPKNLPQGMERGLIEKAIYSGKVASYPNGVHVCELEIDEDTGTVEIVNYNVVDDVGTVINPLLLHGQIDGGIAMGIGQILMEDIKFDERGPDSHRLVHGLCHAARGRHVGASTSIQIRCRPRPIRSASKAPAKPAASAPCRRSPTRWSTRSRCSASNTSICRRRRRCCGGRSMKRGEERVAVKRRPATPSPRSRGEVITR